MPSSISSKSTRSSRSGGSSRAADCGCSEEVMAAWIIIPLITGVAIILALTLSHQEPFSKSARDQREANYYDGYANKEDIAVIDTTVHQFNITMNSAINDDNTVSHATWNGTVIDGASDKIAEKSAATTNIVALHNLD
ncbi:hypothetical protein MAM1_0364c10053 [Mucor ambiguus]|uniref:Uncharacterized protein n=1 Tax=Mucor ambiguus TaxID=91626 RepID=A0A0C9N388_9FUNG|nr:hypothetical protein MAM1_0364c10053 [Mucor ambiguus]